MNSSTTIGATVLAVAGSLSAAFVPQVQHVASQHLTATFIVVGLIKILLGMLPSASESVNEKAVS